jgi:hypothetical protein
LSLELTVEIFGHCVKPGAATDQNTQKIDQEISVRRRSIKEEFDAVSKYGKA